MHRPTKTLFTAAPRDAVNEYYLVKESQGKKSQQGAPNGLLMHIMDALNRTALKISNDKRLVGATISFAIIMLFEWLSIFTVPFIMLLKGTLALYLTQDTLIGVSHSSQVCLALVGFCASAMVWFLPISHLVAWAGFLATISVSFSLLVKPDSNLLPLLGLAAYEAMVAIAAVQFAMPLLLLAPIPLFAQTALSDDIHINCDFSLVLVVVLTCLFSAMSFLLGLGHIACLHDALIASFLLAIKGVIREHEGNLTLEVKHKGEQVRSDSKVLIGEDNILVDRSQIVDNDLEPYLNEGVALNGNEVPLKVGDFKDRILPEGVFLMDSCLLEPQNKSCAKDNYSNSLDNIMGRFVPFALLFSMTSMLGLYIASVPINTVLIIGMTSALACCPCIFLVIPLLSTRLSWMVSDNLGYHVQFNLAAKCGQFWNEVLNTYRLFFDRTRTTHFPVAASGNGGDKDSSYEIDEGAGAYLKSLVKDKHSLSFISGSGGKYMEAYKESLQDYGVETEGNILCNAEYSKGSDSKLEGFNGYCQRINYTGPVIFFGDGDNDASIMERQKCLGIGIEPSEKIKERASMWVSSREAYKSFSKMIPMLIESQNMASSLLIQAIIINAAAILAPSLLWLVFGKVLSMWSSCSFLMVGTAFLGIEAAMFLNGLNISGLGTSNECCVTICEQSPLNFESSEVYCPVVQDLPEVLDGPEIGQDELFTSTPVKKGEEKSNNRCGSVCGCSKGLFQ